MNTENIVERLNNHIKNFDKNYKVDNDDGDLCLDLNDESCIAYFEYFNSNMFEICWEQRFCKDFVGDMDAIKEFYLEAIKLLKDTEIRYTIKISTSPETYLHVKGNVRHGDILFEDLWHSSMWENRFTKLEIEELKQRDDLAIDWDKAVIKEAK